MHKFIVCACKSQDFAQCQKIFARSHDPETVTFRKSDDILTKIINFGHCPKGGWAAMSAV